MRTLVKCMAVMIAAAAPFLFSASANATPPATAVGKAFTGQAGADALNDVGYRYRGYGRRYGGYSRYRGRRGYRGYRRGGYRGYSRRRYYGRGYGSYRSYGRYRGYGYRYRRHPFSAYRGR